MIFRVLINAKKLRKNSFSPSDGGYDPKPFLDFIPALEFIFLTLQLET